MALKYSLSRDNLYIYPWYMADLIAHRDIADLADGAKIKTNFIFFKDSVITAYFDIESANEVGQVLLNKIIADQAFYQKVIDQIYYYSDSMMAFVDRLDKIADASVLTDEELIAWYEEYYEETRQLRVWGWVPVFVDGLFDSFLSNYLREEFTKFLATKNLSDKFIKYYTILSSSEKQSEVQQSELGRLKLIETVLAQADGQKILNAISTGEINSLDGLSAVSLEIGTLFNEYLQKFGWLTYGYTGPAMTFEQLSRQIADDLKTGDIQAQQAKIINHYLDLTSNKQAIIKELDLSPQLIYLFNASAELMFIKDFRKGTYQKSYLAMDKIMLELGRRLGLNLKEIKFLILSEIKEALLNNQSAKYTAIAKERTKICCYAITDGQMEIHQGDEAEALIKQMALEYPEDQAIPQELKGMSAYMGKVSGTVKIVLTVDDIDKVNEGDILVSSATNPDLILAMKKAGAFVTDMGGITSHAAIVSRELKKPCIVGTKFATKLLHDGDEVEVDADNGIVRIIK